MRGPRATASRFSLRRTRGPRKFVAASLAFDILRREFQGRNSLPMVSFRRVQLYTTGYRFIVSSPEGPTGRRGLLASGGGFGPGGLPLGYAPAVTTSFEER